MELVAKDMANQAIEAIDENDQVEDLFLRNIRNEDEKITYTSKIKTRTPMGCTILKKMTERERLYTLLDLK